jgi:signal transduction histidine kinase
VLRQALINIVDNAIKYSPSAGQIRIRTFTVGGHSSLEVRDMGPGIPPDLQQRIFDRFYRYGPDASGNIGVGLGLAIAKSSIEANGGELVCESVAGEGSCFRVQLPRKSLPANPEGCR